MITKLSPPLPSVINKRYPNVKTIDDLKSLNLDRGAIITIAQDSIGQVGGKTTPHLLKDLQRLFLTIDKTNLVYVKKPSARVTVHRHSLLNKLELHEDIFWDQALSEGITSVDQIIFSAIRYGGLLSNIGIFLQQLPQNINLYNKTYWYDLTNDSGETKRWIPDALTLSLISNWKKESDNKIIHYDWIRHLKNGGFKGLSAAQFIDACSTALSLSIPAALVDTAKGLSDTRSLHSDVFSRLITKKSPTLDLTNEEEDQKSLRTNQQVNISHNLDISKTLDAQLFQATGKLLRKAKLQGADLRRQIFEVIDQYKNQCTPCAILLCEWTAVRLSENGYWGNKFSPSTAYTKRSSLRQLLCQQFGSIDIAHLSADELLDAYLEIIDCAESISQKSKLIKSLQDFHYFIQIHYKVPELEDPPWKGLTSGQKNVDAKVVWPHEYNLVMDYLLDEIKKEDEKSRKEQLKRCTIALILGYRCGMRRSEVRLLKMQDVTGDNQKEILVRPYLNLKLKSSSSNRRLPISALLTPKELTIIDRWRKSNTDSYYFLPDIEDNNKCLTAEYLFTPIQQLLKQVTGDSKARFHHLRHSVATINFIRWQLHTQHNLFLKLIDEPNIDIKKQCESILGKGVKSRQRVLHALSAMLGHSGPQMTLQHYIHSTDLLLHHYCNKALPILPQNELGNLLNIKGRQIRKRKKEKSVGFSQVESIVSNRLKSYSQELVIDKWKPPNKTDLCLNFNHEQFRENDKIRLWHALSIASNQKISYSQLSERFSVNEKQLIKVIDNAKQLMMIRHNKGSHKSYRHQSKAWKNKSENYFFYDLPKKTKDEDWVTKILVNYYKLSDIDKEKIKWALNYFIHNSKITSSNINFTNNDDLEKFLAIFQLLKLNHNINDKVYPAYQVTLFHKSKMVSHDREKTWMYWNDTTQLLTNFTHNKQKKYHSTQHGIMALSVLSIKPKRTSHKEAKRQAQWGFRLGLYVLSALELEL